MTYSEIHFSSREYGRTDGTSSRPEYLFRNPLYLSRFCVRNVQVPLTWWNVPVDEILYVKDDVGDETSIAIPKQCYAISDMTTLLQNGLVTNGFVTAVVTTEDRCGLQFLQFDSVADLNEIATFDFRAAPNLKRFLGFTKDSRFYTVTDGLHTLSTPMRPFYSKYLLLRSSMGRGSAFSTHTLAHEGSFGSDNILCKIPLNNINQPPNSYLFFSQYDSPSAETMFNFNGYYLDKMDLYFTHEHETIPIDFNGFDFSVTLGFFK